ncbi:MAG: TetR/AcrR family transcriptional regulator C-terminal domain-containing protein [Thermoleophilia bacterium]
MESRRDRPRLTRDLILDTALAAIDEGGIAACTMRRVAKRLGVEAMSLYWHVDGKDALLDGVIARLMEQTLLPRPERELSWREGFEDFARRFRAMSLAHPQAVPLLAQRAWSAYQAAGRIASDGLTALEAAGFDRMSAVRATRVVSRYVVGFALGEAGSPPVPRPGGEAEPALQALLDDLAVDDQTVLFEFGLETLLDGLEARLAR